jgi:hypothetical protein
MRYRYGPKVELKIAKTGTVAISCGDLLKRVGSNGRVMRIATSTDATALIGVAMKASPTTDPTATIIKIYQIGFGTVFEFISADADTAFKYGQMFKLTSAQPQQLTKYATAQSNPLSSASCVVAICAEELAASASNVYVTFLGCKYNQTIKTGA